MEINELLSKHKNIIDNSSGDIGYFYGVLCLGNDELSEFPPDDIEKIEEANRQTALNFLTAYQDYLDKEGLTKHYFSAYFKSQFLCYEISKSLKTVDENYYRFRWIKTCMRASSENEEKYFFDKVKKDPEEEIEEAILVNNSETLDESLKTYKYNLEKLFHWFLDHYNYCTAKKIISSLQNNGEKKSLFKDKLKRKISSVVNFIFWGAGKALIGIAFVLLLMISLPMFVAGLPSVEQLRFLPLLKSKYDNMTVDSPIASLLLLIYMFILLMTIVIIIEVLLAILKNTQNNTDEDKDFSLLDYFHLFSPRLFNGLLIGYVPLVITTDIWKYIIRMNDLAYLGFILTSVTAGYLLTKLKIHCVVRNAKKARERTIIIYSIGIITSLVIGLVVNDIVALPFLITAKDLSPGENYLIVCGVFGVVLPKVVLFFSPLAYLIGLFMQLVWLDKPISHSL